MAKNKLTSEQAYNNSAIRTTAVIFGAIYVAKSVYTPTRSQINSNTSLESGGVWLYTSRGNNTNIASDYSYTFTEDGTYYISFAYCKDGSYDSYYDRFVIESIKYEL